MAYTIPADTHGSGDSGHVTDHNNIADMLALVSAFNVKNTVYGAVGDGTSNDTAAIQGALTAAGAAGGGVVYAPENTYLTGNLTVPSNVTLIGDGPNATIFKAAPGTSGSVISLGTAATTRFVNLRDFRINCNAVSGCGGVTLDNTGLSPSTPGFHRAHNLIVQGAGAGADGFTLNTQLETILSNCVSVQSARYGFNVMAAGTDSRFIACCSAGSGSDGFYVNGRNLLFSACKAYYSGYNGATFSGTGAGYHFAGGASRIGITACEAQDCGNNGFWFDSAGGACSNIAMSGCVIDSCNALAGAGALTAGINTDTLTTSTITGNAIFNRAGGAGTMAYTVAVTGTQNGLIIGFNANGTGGGMGYISGGGYLWADAALTDFSGIAQFKVGMYQVATAGAQALATGNTITPITANGVYPCTNSGAVTGIIVAVGTIVGQRITIVNQSANTITFAASGTSHVADGVTTPIPANCARDLVWVNSLWYRAA